MDEPAIVITPPAIVEEPVIVETPVDITPPVIIAQPSTPQGDELVQQAVSQIAAFISSVRDALSSFENSPSKNAGAAALVSALSGAEQPPITALGGLVGGSVQSQASTQTNGANQEDSGSSSLLDDGENDDA